MKQGEFQVPLRTGLGLNSREHWATRAKRVANERLAIFVGFPREWLGEASGAFFSHGPWVVTLVRGSFGTLDDDNLRGSLKACRDEVARLLGVDDRDPRVRWEYAQAKVKRGVYWVQVLMQEAPPNEQKPPAIAPKPRKRGVAGGVHR